LMVRSFFRRLALSRERPFRAVLPPALPELRLLAHVPGGSVSMRGVPLLSGRWIVAGALLMAGCGHETGDGPAASVSAARSEADCPAYRSWKPLTPDAQPLQDKTAEVRLDVVKYEPLVQAIQAQRGRVVVVDLWGDFCLPCKREFPRLVKLHQRH